MVIHIGQIHIHISFICGRCMATSLLRTTPFEPSNIFVVVEFFFEPSNIFVAVDFFLNPLQTRQSLLRLDFFEPPSILEIFVAVEFFWSPLEPDNIFVAAVSQSRWCHQQPGLLPPPTFIKYRRFLHGFIAFSLANAGGLLPVYWLFAMGSLPFSWLKPRVHCHFLLMPGAYCLFIGYSPWVHCLFTG